MKQRRLLGFTLVELMVVIGIIILIAALLFPVFSTAMDKVRQTKCLSSQRQIGQAMSMYANDNDEALPPFGDQTPNANYYWDTCLRPYIKSGELVYCPKGPKTSPSIGANYGQIFKYASALSSNGSWYTNLPTYMSNINDPTRRILCADSRSGLHIYSPKVWLLTMDYNGNGTPDSHRGVLSNGTPYNNLAIDRHTGGLNVTFLDGHVKWYSGEILLNSLDLW